MDTFELRTPATLAEAHEILAEYGEEARIVAGATALVLLMKQGLVQPTCLVSLRAVPGLDAIQLDASGLSIGALTTQRALEMHALACERYPVLAETLRHLATPRIRNVATVGGSLAHADPALDLPPTLIALDGTVHLSGPNGERAVPLDEFFLDYYETVREPDEILLRVTVPAPAARSGAAFVKYMPRSADDYATVAVAASVTLAEDGTLADVRLALGSAGSTPIRARQAEDVLRGQAPTTDLLSAAAATVKEEVDPIGDVRGSAEYKREMAGVFVGRALGKALERAR